MKQRRNDIQWMRGVAAVEVAIWHSDLVAKHFSSGRVSDSFYAPVGGIGVELFFIISGYIIAMTVANYRSAKDFALARIVRLYPMYWIFTVLIFLAYLVNKEWMQGSLSFSPWPIVASFLMLPQQRYPVLAPGWSLEHEMCFYALVALAILLFARPTARAVVAVVLVALGTIGLFLGTGPSQLVWDGQLLSPYMILFALGWLFRIADVAGGRKRSVAYAAVFCGLGGLAMLPIQLLERDLLYRIALSAGIFVAVCCARRFLEINNWLNRLATRVGDASYSIYLSHWFVLSMLGKMLGVAGAHAWFDFGARMTAVLLCVVVGLLLFVWVEKPLDRFLRGAVGLAQGGVDPDWRQCAKVLAR